MEFINLHKAEFILSAARPDQFVKDGRPQFVFAGRSNVGKSSVINKILNRRNFARVGETPGKTAHVNYFLLDSAAYFVDLPGYGYARVSQTEKQRWAALMENFFADTSGITQSFLIVDARHTPNADDKIMAEYFQQTCVPFSVIANKADKLKPRELPERLEDIRRTLVLDERDGLFAFSAQTGQGRDDVLARLRAVWEGLQ
ncbi:MAG: ribosome biogenesis GTP-binding protein YihA/YsxC [Oscillospiraceae bacterium]|jgi:GTP-binding protein|nr:ribosome biogenesis GTP-binding protein YihA/YsxC [Oscillospiraceae bacterium]